MTATVLIVDDSTFIVEGLVAILKKRFRALPSFGGEECLAILRTEKPDIIVLDIMMEPMDGWETLARIKENPATRHIPVLMFSAKKISPEEAEAHRIRIDDFLTKPVNPRELVVAIEKILEREKRNRAILAGWAKAGHSRETIDEYLTRYSNLEVDTSLLAAMKKQLDHPTTPAARREDLAATIAVLEERIATGRGEIARFFETTGLTLPSPEEIVEANLPDPGEGTEEETAIPLAGRDESPVSTAPAGSAPAEAAAVTAPAAPAGPPAREAKAVPDQQPIGTREQSGGEAEPAEAPAPRPWPARKPPAAPAVVAGSRTEVPAPAAEIPAPSDAGGNGRVEWISIPSHADPFSRRNNPDIDHLLGHEPAPSAPGAGTPAHIPLPSITHSIRHDGDRQRKDVQHGPPPAGFFSRIIAMITGLFRRD